MQAVLLLQARNKQQLLWRRAFLLMKATLDSVEDDEIVHVYPQFGREHVTDQRDQCWCQPRVQFEGDGAIIIHEVEQ